MGCFDANTQPEKAADEPVKQTRVVERIPGTFQLVGIDGQPIFTSDLKLNPRLLPENKHRAIREALPEILTKAIDSDIAPREIVLMDLQLPDVNLAGFNLRGISLIRCGFRNADLRNINLGEANLNGCYFGECRMTGANFEGAELEDANFEGVEAGYIRGIIAPMYLDDYYVWGYGRKHEEEGPRELRVRAGCRDFHLDEARKHWQRRPDRQQIFASLELMERIADHWGWTGSRKGKRERGKTRVEVEEDEG